VVDFWSPLPADLATVLDLLGEPAGVEP